MSSTNGIICIDFFFPAAFIDCNFPVIPYFFCMFTQIIIIKNFFNMLKFLSQNYVIGKSFQKALIYFIVELLFHAFDLIVHRHMEIEVCVMDCFICL